MFNRTASSRKSSGKIIFFIGKMGAGKSYLGKLVAHDLGAVHFDGDDAISSWVMKQQVAWGLPLSGQQVDTYIRHDLFKKVDELHQKHELLVVSQALYRNHHRRIFQEYFGKENVIFVHVDTPQSQRIVQLHQRGLFVGKMWQLHSWLSDQYFELPADDLSACVIKNSLNQQALLQQLHQLPFYQKKHEADFISTAKCH